MKTLCDISTYRQDVKEIAGINIEWDMLRNSTLLISGASGLIGSFLIDVLMEKKAELNCKIIALGRNEKKARRRFDKYWDDENFIFIAGDINQGVSLKLNTVDYILHMASNTHPVAYATDPIGTITTNILGTKNLLDLACEKQTKRVVFLSSVEIYGENRGDSELFTEDYCGYIDSNTLRAGYPESKRVGESLCQAYIKQYNLDIVIPRLARTYGPSVLNTDTKAINQFIRNGLNKENIVLKSDGKQLYSYSYVADAASAILLCMLYGRKGEAYNVADTASNITLKELAELIADYCNTEVEFQLPNAVEQAGFSKATKAIMDSNKLKDIGWESLFDIRSGLKHTIDILSELEKD